MHLLSHQWLNCIRLFREIPVLQILDNLGQAPDAWAIIDILKEAAPIQQHPFHTGIPGTDHINLILVTNIHCFSRLYLCSPQRFLKDLWVWLGPDCEL